MMATVRRFDDVSVVDLCGKLVVGANVSALREEALRLLESGRSLILLNLERVPYLDASGIGELVAFSARVRSRGGSLKLLRPSTKVRDLLELSHLEDAFETYRDEARARASFYGSRLGTLDRSSCPYCGAEVLADDYACPMCRQVIPWEKEEAPKPPRPS